MVTSRKQTSIPHEEYTLEEEALVRQWLEYKKIILDPLKSQPLPNSICAVSQWTMNNDLLSLWTLTGCLQELNDELSTKTFLAGIKYSKADLDILLGIQHYYVSDFHYRRKIMWMTLIFRPISHSSSRKNIVTFQDGTLKCSISTKTNYKHWLHSVEVLCIEIQYQPQ